MNHKRTFTYDWLGKDGKDHRATITVEGESSELPPWLVTRLGQTFLERTAS